MVQMDVVVKVIAEYMVEVTASSGLEAQEKASGLVRNGVVDPDEVNAIIMEVKGG